MIAPARVAAYKILLAVSTGRVDLPTATASARASLDDERDRALATEIVNGVQRWRAAIDHLIVQFSKRQIDRLDAEVVEILRIGIYQLLHLTRVPASAVVDDAVELSRRAGKRSASGFVNAVLRSVSRKRASLPLPARPADPDADRDAAIDYLSITLSHPRWLASRWYDRLGFVVTETWLLFNNEAAPLTLRANRLRVTREDLVPRLAEQGVIARFGRFAPDALLVEAGHPSGHDFVIQDEASQLVTLLAGDRPGPRVLDTCASPGGKATAIAASMVGPAWPARPTSPTRPARPASPSLLVACDVRSRRMDLLRRTVHDTGAEGIVLVQADLRQPLPFQAVFDCVIVDAPCSGLGTLRRDPDIKWRREESDLAALADAQHRMLRNAAEVVAPGGRLIYATCSSEPEENEAIAGQFLRETPRFSPMDAARAHSSLPATVIDSRGHLRTSPDRHGLEAFFGAVFERL